MSNEATADVLKIQQATLKRWLALAAKQCDKVNGTLMKNMNVPKMAQYQRSCHQVQSR